MQIKFQFYKANTLPNTIVPGTVYAIGENDNLRLLLGDSQGVPRELGKYAWLHDQSQSPSALWNINHNLNRRPNVEIYTTGWVRVVAEVQHIDVTRLEIRFAGPCTGFACLT